MSTSVALACPLCSGTESEVADRLSGADLLRLWRVHGNELSKEAFSPVAPETVVEFHHCKKCGFRFFDPELAGGPRFYEELSRDTDYSEETPEFADVLDFATSNGVKDVFDVGCGHGAFLDMAAARGLRTHGLEMTPASAEHSRKRGHQVFTTPLEKLPADALAPVGLVTMFQVVEHVRDPRGFVTLAKAFAKPGGWVAVSVPYEGGINGIVDLVPHQWPPHHVTRWRSSDLRALGTACGLRLASLRANSLAGVELRRYLRLNARLGAALEPPRKRVSGLLVTMLGWAYTLSGARHWFPRMGSNVTAIYQVPEN